MKDLKGKTAIVTGGGGGIGGATSRRFADEGAQVAVFDMNLEAAQKLADFSASEAANHLYKTNFAVLAIPSIATANPHLPADLNQRLIDNNFVWAAENRERIIEEWTKRYDGKSEAKK